MKTKNILSIILVIIIAILTIIGYFLYNYYKKPNIQNENMEVFDNAHSLSETSIIEAMNRISPSKLVKNSKGFYEAGDSKTIGYMIFDSAIKGDLNEDSFQDAIVPYTTCGASCGIGFEVILNNSGKSTDNFGVAPEGIVFSGAGQSLIKNIFIKDGVIFINVENFQDGGDEKPLVESIFKYKLIGKNLVKQ